MVNDAGTPGIASMTGYATLEGDADGRAWSWEIRSVNARGLDLRLRLPDGFGALEAPLRKRLSADVARGSVTLNLRLGREGAAGAALHLDPDALAAALDALAAVTAAAEARGVPMAPTSAADILALKGVADASEAATTLPAADLLLTDVETLIAAFLAMRLTEGKVLADLLSAQLARIAELTEAASEAAEQRSETQAERLRAGVAALLEAAEGFDEARLTQEMAIMAVKSDVTEEIDRLRAHVAAARDLIAAGGPVGRKLDFLMQEFNREANTLCSKSGDTALTAIGLDLKLAIDQMREQVQNVE